MIKQRTTYGLMVAGSTVGLTASFLETIEYQEMLKNAHAPLVCNLNSVFSCGSVLNAWQSKIFGFPNSMLCMIFFTCMLTSALVGLTGGVLLPRLRLWLQGIAIFFLCFALWFMWESTFYIHALCILCLFCIAGLLMLNWGWLRINAKALPLSERHQRQLHVALARGDDILVWLLLAIFAAFIMLLKFNGKL